VYVAVALILFSPPRDFAAHALADQFSVPARTVKRWRIWWHRDFQQTRFWQSVRERFAPSVGAEGLPHSLLVRFQGPSCHERLVQLLCFVRPLSVGYLIK
jgi:hypothetical protein